MDKAWSLVKENDSFSYREFNFTSFVDYNDSLIAKIERENFSEINGLYKVVLDKFKEHSEKIESRIQSMPKRFLDDISLNDSFVSKKQNKEYFFKNIKLESSATTDNLVSEFSKLGYVPVDLHQMLEASKVFPHIKKDTGGLWSLLPAFNYKHDLWLPFLANVSMYDQDNSSLGVACRTPKEIEERSWVPGRGSEKFVFVKK